MNEKGKIMIKFSEDVYSIDNIKNATFLKLQKRDLQEIVELQYIDIRIEPGDPSLDSYDPEKLLFDYNAEFTDDKTLEI